VPNDIVSHDIPQVSGSSPAIKAPILVYGERIDSGERQTKRKKKRHREYSHIDKGDREDSSSGSHSVEGSKSSEKKKKRRNSGGKEEVVELVEMSPALILSDNLSSLSSMTSLYDSVEKEKQKQQTTSSKRKTDSKKKYSFFPPSVLNSDGD
ncbi:hypothetical protein ADUPG1_008845, partial [Aduncisulcus paluster]